MDRKSTPQSHFGNRTVIHLLLITGLWLLAIFLVNPLGDFPLNDDWAYGMTVHRFLAENTFRPPGWPAMTLISQTMWGVLISVLLGFSFQTLHLANLFLSWIVLVCLYYVIRELSEQRWHALLVTALLAFNPIYFPLSFTFMTEITFIFYILLSFLFLIRNLKTHRKSDILFGACFTILAVLCRQNGLFVPVAFALVYLLKQKLSLRSFFWAGLPVIAGLMAWAGFQHWMNARGNLSQSYNLVIQAMIQSLLHHPGQLLYSVPRNLFFILQYLGLFLLPALILFRPSPISNQRMRFMASGLIVCYLAGTGYLSFVKGHLMPLFTKFESILITEGTGPLTLNDTFIRHLTHVQALPDGIWICVTVLSIAGGALLLNSLASFLFRLFWEERMFLKEEANQLEIFTFLAAVIYVVPLAIATIFFDRYVLPLFIPLALYVVLSGMKRALSPHPIVKWGSAVLVGCLAYFSMMITHDYLAWNRARWEAIDSLMNEKGIAASEIDGGFEFNGLYFYSEAYPIENAAPGKSWWWIQEDGYLLTFGEVDGYEVFRRFPYNRWLPRSEGQILILKREETS